MYTMLYGRRWPAPLVLISVRRRKTPDRTDYSSHRRPCNDSSSVSDREERMRRAIRIVRNDTLDRTVTDTL